MEKGFNTIVEETKVELLNFVNSKLQKGLPISVISLIIDNMSTQIKKEINNVLEQERQMEQQEKNKEGE